MRRLRGPQRRAVWIILCLGALAVGAPAANAGLIVWAKNPGFKGPMKYGEIWVANDDGSNPRVLYAPQGELPGIPSPHLADHLEDPRISADGSTLVFAAQWNNRYYTPRGSTTCGLYCTGIYMVRNGAVARLSGGPPGGNSTNGCPGSGYDTCSSYEDHPILFDDGSILFAHSFHQWLNCTVGGCPQAPSSIQEGLAAFDSAGKRSDLFSWSERCGGEGRVSGDVFDGTPAGKLLLNGCYQSGISPILVDDLTVGALNSSPRWLSLSADGQRVASVGQGPYGDSRDGVWTYSATTPAEQKGAADYALALVAPSDRAFHSAALVGPAGERIAVATSDGNLYLVPGACGTAQACTFPESLKVIAGDGDPEVTPSGLGSPKISNTSPSWTSASKVTAGAPSPVVTQYKLTCPKRPSGACRIKARFTTSVAGSVTFTLTTRNKRGVFVAFAKLTTSSPKGVVQGVLPATIGGKKVKPGRYRVAVQLAAGGKKSTLVTLAVTVA